MIDFKDQVRKSGIPVTEKDIKSEFLKVAEATDNPLNNKDEYSPYWAIVHALCVQPAMWIIRFLYESVLPNQYLRTASGQYLQLLGWAYEEEKKLAKKAIGNITFQRISAGGNQTIAAGHIIHSLPVAGVSYKLQTLEDLVFVNGDVEKQVLCEALTVGENYNLGAGIYVILPESIAGIARIYNKEDWLVSLGADEEEDDEYRLRIRDKFSQLNQFHVDTVYKNIISQFDGIKSTNVHFDKTAPRGAGSADALILLDHGEVSEVLLAEINHYIRDLGNHGIGDDIQVKGLEKNNVSLVVDLYFDSATPVNDRVRVKEGVSSFINAAFRKVPVDDFVITPKAVEPFKRFSFSHLSGQLHREYQELLSVDFDNEDLIHGLNVSKLESLEVNVHAE